MDLGYWNKETGYSRRLRPWVGYGAAFMLTFAVARMFSGNPKDLILGPIVWPAIGAIFGLLAWCVIRVWDYCTNPRIPTATYKVPEER